MVLDIPPRVRLVLAIGAVIGVSLVVMQSLAGDQPGTIRVDRSIHFSGYAILAASFVLALRPAFFFPCSRRCSASDSPSNTSSR